MIIEEKPSLDEALLEHFGVKGMHWGVRKKENLTNKQQIARINKKISKLDIENRYVEGAGLVGRERAKIYKRRLKKDPKFTRRKLSTEQKLADEDKSAARISRKVVIAGAIEAGVIIGGTLALAKATKASPQAKRGATVSAVILAGRAGSIRISQLRSIHTVKKFEKLDIQRDALGYMR